MKRTFALVLIAVILLQLCIPSALAAGKHYCKYCGGQIDDDSIFCSHCGKKLVSDSVPAPAATPAPVFTPVPTSAPAPAQTSAPVSFARSQYYNADDGTVKVYTVQYSAGDILAGAVKNRDSMLDYGNDAFIYKKGDYYHIMTGKFRDYEEARDYLRLVRNIKGADDGFIATVYLPEQAVAEFESVYAQSGFSSADAHDGTLRWSAWFPQGFDCYDSGENSRLYYNSEQSMSVVITQEEICATSPKSRDKILNYAFEAEKACHSNIKDSSVKDNHFDVTGYDGSYIYYTRGIVTSEMFYTISFSYPVSNRRWCDPNLESICAGFRTF